MSVSLTGKKSDSRGSVDLKMYPGFGCFASVTQLSLLKIIMDFISQQQRWTGAQVNVI